MRLISTAMASRLHLLDGLPSGFDHAEVALLAHHLDLAFEAVVELDRLLPLGHGARVGRGQAAAAAAIVVLVLHEVRGVAHGGGRGRVASRLLVRYDLVVVSLDGRSGLLVHLLLEAISDMVFVPICGVLAELIVDSRDGGGVDRLQLLLGVGDRGRRLAQTERLDLAPWVSTEVVIAASPGSFPTPG